MAIAWRARGEIQRTLITRALPCIHILKEPSCAAGLVDEKERSEQEFLLDLADRKGHAVRFISELKLLANGNEVSSRACIPRLAFGLWQ